MALSFDLLFFYESALSGWSAGFVKQWVPCKEAVMETIEQIAERHIRESEARLDHIDVLMKRAQKVSANTSDQVEA